MIGRFFSQVRYIRRERCLNRVTLIGRIGQDAMLKGSPSTPVVQFKLATNLVLGETSATEWHKIAVFKPGLLTLAEKYCKSGTRVLVEGRISYGSYKNNMDQEIQATSIIAEDIIFLSESKANTEETI